LQKNDVYGVVWNQQQERYISRLLHILSWINNGESIKISRWYLGWWWLKTYSPKGMRRSSLWGLEEIVSKWEKWGIFINWKTWSCHDENCMFYLSEIDTSMSTNVVMTTSWPKSSKPFSKPTLSWRHNDGSTQKLFFKSNPAWQLHDGTFPRAC
jgi:hypothetical protein